MKEVIFEEVDGYPLEFDELQDIVPLLKDIDAMEHSINMLNRLLTSRKLQLHGIVHEVYPELIGKDFKIDLKNKQINIL